MLHFDQVKERVISTLSKFIDSTNLYYIVRDVFGRISIYVEVYEENPDLEENLRGLLNQSIGPYWVDKIQLFEPDNYIFKNLKESALGIQHKNNLFFSERHLTRLNWFESQSTYNQNSLSDNNIKCKVVTFYSFKGGLGRTTSLVLSALQLVRQGRKVVLVDFDLEAPGLSTLLSPENGELPRYGVVDYLIESQVYTNTENELDIDEYVYSFQDKDLIGAKGGQLYIVPASNMMLGSGDNYLEKMSRIDFGMPKYFEVSNPIKDLLERISMRFDPDFIFLDSRTGIHDVGGLTLTRFSDIGVLMFYGNEQNITGMNIILPRILKIGLPFYLINGPVPLSDEESREEEEYFLENSYRILIENGAYPENNIPDLYEKSADHYPFVVKYDPQAMLINSNKKIQSLLETGGKENVYLKIAEELSSSIQDKNSFEIIATNYLKNRIDILPNISRIILGDTAAAETEFNTLEDLTNNFFPFRDHKFIFEQDKFLILGPKGSGKTALFSVLEHKEYARDLAKFVGLSSDSIERTKWVTGLKNSNEFPSKVNFDSLGKENDINWFKSYWRFLAVKAMSDSLKSLRITIPDEIKSIFTATSIEIKKQSKDILISEKIEDFFMYLDRYLENSKENIIITYDALDILLNKSYRGLMIAALISLWFEYLPRFRNIRVKIFLRDDIFKNEVKEGITDKVKLRNFTANLAWDYDTLLAMVWKRMAQRSHQIANLFDEVLKPVGLSLVKHNNLLGYVPKADEEANKLILSVIMGEKMGKGNKAYTYNWIKYHLSDTNDNILPRSILALFALAARKEEDQNDDRGQVQTLIKPKSFELIMQQVSEDRVTDLFEEYSEYKNIFINLKNYLRDFPANEEDLKEALIKCGVPRDMGKTVIDELQGIGLFKPYQRKLSDPIRYHIPDIFLLGMGLSRKGPGFFKAFNKK